nr:MAG TPA: hypothetical protein [Caudoviricetes sp.]
MQYNIIIEIHGGDNIDILEVMCQIITWIIMLWASRRE